MTTCPHCQGSFLIEDEDELRARLAAAEQRNVHDLRTLIAETAARQATEAQRDAALRAGQQALAALDEYARLILPYFSSVILWEWWNRSAQAAVVNLRAVLAATPAPDEEEKDG